MIHLALRFDDPSATSNVDLEQAIFGRLQAQHARATVAVIPFKRKDDVPMTLDAARASHLISAQRAGVIQMKTLVELATGPVNQFIADALKGRRRLQALPAWLSHHLPQRSLCAVSLGRLFRTRVFGVH